MASDQKAEIPNGLWFRTFLTLDSLCAQLEKQLGLRSFEFDAENVFEWGEAEALDGTWEINVSRKHKSGSPLPQEPYHVRLKGKHPPLALLARVLAQITTSPVHWGTIEYVGGNDYAYHPISTVAV
jgi:hypothetical protein